MDLGNIILKRIIKGRHIFPEKPAHIQQKWKIRSKSNVLIYFYLTIWSLLVMKNVKNQYRPQVKVEYIQIKPTNKGVLKHVSTRYLLDQHWVVVVRHIRTLVLSCQKIQFHADFNHIHKKEGLVLMYEKKVTSIHGIFILTTCVYQHCGEKTGFMLEIYLLDVTLH